MQCLGCTADSSGEFAWEVLIMSITAEAVYENGTLKLKQPLPFAEQEQEHVRVTVESTHPSHDTLRQGLAALRQLCDEQPIHSGGLRFTRDELHERH